MKEILKNIGNLIVKSITFNNNISSTRLLTVWSGLLFSITLVYGFGVVLIHYGNLIIEYAGILTAALLGMLGVKAYEKKSTHNTLVDNTQNPNSIDKNSEN